LSPPGVIGRFRCDKPPIHVDFAAAAHSLVHTDGIPMSLKFEKNTEAFLAVLSMDKE